MDPVAHPGGSWFFPNGLDLGIDLVTLTLAKKQNGKTMVMNYELLIMRLGSSSNSRMYHDFGEVSISSSSPWFRSSKITESPRPWGCLRTFQHMSLGKQLIGGMTDLAHAYVLSHDPEVFVISAQAPRTHCSLG